MDENLYYLGFSACSGIGPVKFAKLLERFGSAQHAWEASDAELLNILGKAVSQKFIHFRKEFLPEKFAESLKKKNVQYVCRGTSEYPPLLNQIPQAPIVLYVKGNIVLLQGEKTIGIVGTRKITGYGRTVTQSLTADLVAEGFVIISGLALGVDGVAHQTTVNVGGQTIAVLGSGVDFCTPREQQRLYEEILEKNGAIVSTFLPGEAAGIGSFPARNRIVAGLSLGVLVTEGAADSGALITANFAKEFARPVFAVPGPITSALSKGANDLLGQGAILTTSSKAILDMLGIMGVQKTQKITISKMSDDKDELQILSFLEFGALHFDDIVRKMSKDSKSIGSLLSVMELKGLVKSNPEGKYTLNPYER